MLAGRRCAGMRQSISHFGLPDSGRSSRGVVVGTVGDWSPQRTEFCVPPSPRGLGDETANGGVDGELCGYTSFPSALCFAMAFRRFSRYLQRTRQDRSTPRKRNSLQLDSCRIPFGMSDPRTVRATVARTAEGSTMSAAPKSRVAEMRTTSDSRRLQDSLNT